MPLIINYLVHAYFCVAFRLCFMPSLCQDVGEDKLTYQLFHVYQRYGHDSARGTSRPALFIRCGVYHVCKACGVSYRDQKLYQYRARRVFWACDGTEGLLRSITFIFRFVFRFLVLFVVLVLVFVLVFRCCRSRFRSRFYGRFFFVFSAHGYRAAAAGADTPWSSPKKIKTLSSWGASIS